MNDTLKAEYKKKNVERVSDVSSVKDEKIKAAVLAALAKAQKFMDKLKGIKEKLASGEVLTPGEINFLKSCKDLGIDLASFLGASIDAIVSEQNQKLLDAAKGIFSPPTKVQADEKAKKSETKVDGEKKAIKPLSEKSPAGMAKDVSEEKDKLAGLTAGAWTKEMISALNKMNNAGVSLDQLKDGTSSEMAGKMKDAGLTGDEVENMSKKGIKLGEIEAALGGKESDALLAKFKSINLPHTIENLAASGVTVDLMAKLEKNGLTLDELSKLMGEPIDGSLVSAMADAEKDIALVKEANQKINA